MRGLSVLPLRRKALSAVAELGRARGGEMCPTSSSREEGAVHGVGEGVGVDANDEEVQVWEVVCQQQKIGEGFDSGRQSAFTTPRQTGHQDFLH